MWVGVLGPTLVQPADGAAPIALTAAKHRALLAALALSPGRPVSAEALVRALWGPDAPPSAQGSLHSYLSVVRRTLEPDLTARAPSRHLVSSDLGYELVLAPDQVDASAFATAVTAVHAALGELVGALAPVATDRPAATAQLTRLEEALALWRGEPYADVVDAPAVEAERARLAELRLLAEEDRATLLVALGDDAVVAELEALVAREPLRERRWTLLAVALARAGRQADALSALDRLRTVLDEELGLEPSPFVRELQTAVLRQELAAVPAQEAAAAHAREPRAAGPGTPFLTEVPEPEWPLVGRGAELGALDAAWQAADAGTPVFVTLVGEPGAGKTRLAIEVARRARDAGAGILLGRCSQEEDAPPLWPWTTALGREYAGTSDDHDLERFEIAEAIRQQLTGLAADRPVLLVLEDVHWADASSLRVLRHVAAHTDSARLLVLTTSRPGEAGSAFAETSATLARTGGTTLEVPGLSAEEARGVVGAISGDDLDPATAEALRLRTDGNAFFLVEYARLARDKPEDLAAVLDSTPRAISDVVQRRLHQLPAPTAEAVTAGAVIGREFDLDLLAPALGLGELATLDLLEPALRSELLSDLGADRFRFSHALARDTAYAELSPSRRERMHARLAELVEAAPAAHRRTAEIARHWTAAGPRHVDRAWRAEMRAGHRAMRAHAAEEAAQHFGSALALQEHDRAATPRDRWDLLVGYADACRWSTRLVEMTRAVDEAIVIGDSLTDPDLVAGAALVLADGAVWPVRNYGVVVHPVVDAMRRALDLLPPEDTEVRCRLLLLLAGELFYGNHRAEVDALTEQSVAMARRLGDRRLLLSVLTYGFSVRWRRETTAERELMAAEAVRLAEEEGDARTGLLARFLLAVVRCSRGDLDGLDAEVAEVRDSAREHRLHFLELATLTLSQSWAAMRGDEIAIAAHNERLGELDELISVPQKADALQGAVLVPFLWSEELPPPESFLSFVGQANIPIGPAFSVLLLRHGQRDLAEQVWAGAPFDAGEDTWFAELLWSFGAEAALALGDAGLAADLYRRLSPLAGQCVVSGTGPAHGPADAYLALAAAAAGEVDLARDHASRATELIAAWRIPRVAAWFGALREQHGF